MDAPRCRSCGERHWARVCGPAKGQPSSIVAEHRKPSPLPELKIVAAAKSEEIEGKCPTCGYDWGKVRRVAAERKRRQRAKKGAV